MLIDTHAHLNCAAFAKDCDAVLQRAHQAGVKQVIVVGMDESSSEKAVEMAEHAAQPGGASIFAAVGVHPHDAAKFHSSSLNRFRQWCKHPKVVAVGEIGLDFYRDYTTPAQQREVFKTFLALAQDVNLPVIIHSRKAGEEILEILTSGNFQGVKGVFHCFSGNETLAQQVLELGFYISFTGVVTFPNARAAIELLPKLPIERLLVETDAPYLAPVPYRGKRNEPAYVRLIAEKYAEVCGMTIEQIEKVTTENALKLFPKLGVELSGGLW
ncbi:hydrolase TatD [candidate division KSB1 bacterium]|nr:MAG: hydrolase TatD [candidate division KSB1 bacterium]